MYYYSVCKFWILIYYIVWFHKLIHLNWSWNLAWWRPINFLGKFILRKWFLTLNLENYTKKVHFKYFQCLTALNWRWAFGLDWTWWRPINFLGSGYPILVALGIASMSELQQTSSLCKKGIKCNIRKEKNIIIKGG